VKTWQILTVGTAALVAVLLLPLYESLLAGVGAIVVVVGLGFGLHLRRDVFYVRTTARLSDPDGNLSLQHDQLAVKVEPARLWVLFLPTSLAVAFLVVTAANGTLWKFSLVNLIFSEYAYALIITGRLLLFLVTAALSIWISERWVLTDADATSAKSLSATGGRVSFTFEDRSGGNCGGESVYFGLVRPVALARLVLHNVRKPELNNIGMGLLFHRLIILGQGLTDLDEQTAAANTVLAETAP
jgi:hypothetical protein